MYLQLTVALSFLVESHFTITQMTILYIWGNPIGQKEILELILVNRRQIEIQMYFNLCIIEIEAHTLNMRNTSSTKLLKYDNMILNLRWEHLHRRTWMYLVKTRYTLQAKCDSLSMCMHVLCVTERDYVLSNATRFMHSYRPKKAIAFIAKNHYMTIYWILQECGAVGYPRKTRPHTFIVL